MTSEHQITSLNVGVQKQIHKEKQFSSENVILLKLKIED